MKLIFHFKIYSKPEQKNCHLKQCVLLLTLFRLSIEFQTIVDLDVLDHFGIRSDQDNSNIAGLAYIDEKGKSFVREKILFFIEKMFLFYSSSIL